MEKYVLKFFQVLWQVVIGFSAGSMACFIAYAWPTRQVNNHCVLIGVVVGAMVGHVIGRWVYRQIHQ